MVYREKFDNTQRKFICFGKNVNNEQMVQMVFKYQSFNIHVQIGNNHYPFFWRSVCEMKWVK